MTILIKCKKDVYDKENNLAFREGEVYKLEHHLLDAYSSIDETGKDFVVKIEHWDDDWFYEHFNELNNANLHLLKIKGKVYASHNEIIKEIIIDLNKDEFFVEHHDLFATVRLNGECIAFERNSLTITIN